MSWLIVKGPCISWTVNIACDVLDWGKHKVLQFSLNHFPSKSCTKSCRNLQKIINSWSLNIIGHCGRLSKAKVCVNCIRLLCTEIFRTVKQNQVIFVQSTLHQPGCQNQNKGAVTLCSQQGEATALQVLAAPTTISWPIFPFCILVSGEAPDKASHHLDVFYCTIGELTLNTGSLIYRSREKKQQILVLNSRPWCKLSPQFIWTAGMVSFLTAGTSASQLECF